MLYVAPPLKAAMAGLRAGPTSTLEKSIMARSKTNPGLTKMPNQSCPACHGLGMISMTAHFYTGDVEWDATCWECFGDDVKLQYPHPRKADNG